MPVYELISNNTVIGRFRTRWEAEAEARKRKEFMEIYCGFAYFPYEIKEVEYGTC